MKYANLRRKREARYGKAAVFCVAAPYFYQCFMRQGWGWKICVFYGIIATIHAIYDCGMYASFFVHGPSIIRSLINLDKKESFSPIQT